MVADRLEGLSPEGVFVTMPLANVGSRSLAGAIDLGLQALLLWGTLAVLEGDRVVAAIRAIVSFLILFFTPIAFDMLDSGRGPGKRLFGLRVVTLRGGPVGFRSSAIRNLLRPVDFLPMGYAVGIASVLSTETGQRFGDLAAGTVVTIKPGRLKAPKMPKVAAVPKLSRRERKRLAPPSAFRVEAPSQHALEAAAVIDAIQITAQEVGLVQSFLARRDTLPASARTRLGADIAGRLRPRVLGVGADVTDEEFLELLATAKAMRR